MTDTFKSQSFIDQSGLPPNWREEANCKGVDPNIFHPRRGEDTKKAVAICVGCLVVEECLHYALSNNIKVGIWGAQSERQRRIMRRENKL